MTDYTIVPVSKDMRELLWPYRYWVFRDEYGQLMSAGKTITRPGARRLARRDNRKIRRASHERLSL